MFVTVGWYVVANPQHVALAKLPADTPTPLPDGHRRWSHDNRLSTPHNAGHTPRYWDCMADIIADTVDRLDTDEPLRDLAK